MVFSCKKTAALLVVLCLLFSQNLFAITKTPAKDITTVGFTGHCNGLTNVQACLDEFDVFIGGAVTSVNGKTGVVVLNTDDIQERVSPSPVNLWFTAARAISALTSTLTNYVLKTTTVNGHALSGNISVTKSDVGLGNADNTSDVNKPISIATQTALDLKQDILGYTAEDVANKSTNTSLGTSNTLYPSQNAVKSYVDTGLAGKVTANGAITGATKTKITYDAKGLVTAGADATTADIADSLNKRYVTDAQLTVIGNTSGTNTGDVTLSGSPDYITISGQVITRALINLATHVTGDLPFANLTQIAGLSVLGVTGSSTADVAAITAGTDNQVLRRSGTALGFGAVNLASSNAVTGALIAGSFPALTGDVTTVAGALATTLATVNGNVGSFGSSTAIPVITANAKGLITALSTAAVIAPAGTLTGTTLAANVVSSSLTSVGTLVTGVWNATKISEIYGGTNQNSYALGDILYSSATDILSKLAGNTTTTKKFLRQTGNGTISAAPAWDTVLKADVGLGNVENTALSTWAGSTNLTTLGTISTGLWNGTAIGIAYGGLGVSLSDPGANKIIGWDDTDNTNGYWSLGSGLTYDHATHTLSAPGGGSGSITAVGDIVTGDAATAALPITYAYFKNATSGSVKLQTTTGALGSSVISLPAGTDTLVGKATTDTLTNKTFDTAGTGNSFSINSLAATANTGTGAVVRATSPALVTPALGTPSSGTLTNATGLPISTGISGLAAGIAAWLATPSSANLITAMTDETGSGSLVFATSPVLVTPALGTPSSGTLTNATGLPVATGISGLGSNVATFLATPSSANFASAVTGETGSGAVVFATSPALTTPDIGTPSAGTLTNATGLPVSTGISGLGSGVATFLATPSSANLATALTNEIGTGGALFATAVQNNLLLFGADAGSTDAYAITLSPVPAGYVTGQCFTFTANTANTGNATLNVNSLGAKNILKNYSATLANNDIKAGQAVDVCYDGTEFQMQSQLGNASGGGGSPGGSDTQIQYNNAGSFGGSGDAYFDFGNLELRLGAVTGYFQIIAGAPDTEAELDLFSSSSTLTNTGPLFAGSGNSTGGNSGIVSLKSGLSSTGNSGELRLGTGNATVGNSANVVVSTGTAGGTRGSLTIDTQTSYLDTSGNFKIFAPSWSTSAPYFDINNGNFDLYDLSWSTSTSYLDISNANLTLRDMSNSGNTVFSVSGGGGMSFYDSIAGKVYMSASGGGGFKYRDTIADQDVFATGIGTGISFHGIGNAEQFAAGNGQLWNRDSSGNTIFVSTSGGIQSATGSNNLFIAADGYVRSYQSGTLNMSMEQNGVLMGNNPNGLNLNTPSGSTPGEGFITLQPGDRTGTDSAGSQTVIYGGKGTGNAVGGPIYFYTSPPDTSTGSGANTAEQTLIIDGKGHLRNPAFFSKVPSVSSCGSSPSLDGSDMSGTITVGTGTVTSCQVDFYVAYDDAPRCFVNDRSSFVAIKASASTSALVITSSTTIGGDTVDYHCISK